MLFKEYDSAAHIASEKEISYEEGLQDGREEGRRSEQKNTEREKERADKLQTKFDALLEALILSYREQGKSPEEIAALCEQSTDFILNILKKHNLNL